jgi:hypothetical protein
MKVPIAYYLVLLYVTVMFKPLIPVISDVLSHTFSEAIHIATVHAIYGSNHLEKELSNASPDNANNKHQNSTNGEDPVPVHVSAQEDVYGFYCTGPGKDYCSLKLYDLKAGFILKNYPPPQILLVKKF